MVSETSGENEPTHFEPIYNIDLILTAAIIKCSVPHPEFTEELALWCAGMSVALAKSKNCKDGVISCLDHVRKNHPIIINEQSTSNILERAKILVSNAVRVPKKVRSRGIPSIEALQSEFGSKAITDYCALAGFPSEWFEGTSKPQYQQIFEFKKRLQEGSVSPVISTSLTCTYGDRRLVRLALSTSTDAKSLETDDKRIDAVNDKVNEVTRNVTTLYDKLTDISNKLDKLLQLHDDVELVTVRAVTSTKITDSVTTDEAVKTEE